MCFARYWKSALVSRILHATVACLWHTCRALCYYCVSQGLASQRAAAGLLVAHVLRADLLCFARFCHPPPAGHCKYSRNAWVKVWLYQMHFHFKFLVKIASKSHFFCFVVEKLWILKACAYLCTALVCFTRFCSRTAFGACFLGCAIVFCKVSESSVCETNCKYYSRNAWVRIRTKFSQFLAHCIGLLYSSFQNTFFVSASKFVFESLCAVLWCFTKFCNPALVKREKITLQQDCFWRMCCALRSCVLKGPGIQSW